MMYFIAPLYTLLFYIANLFNNKGRDKLMFSITFFIPVVLVLLYIGMFRDVTVGTDTRHYQFLFDFSNHYIEIGFLYFTFLVKFFGGEFNLFLALFFLFSLAIKLYGFSRVSIYPSLSLLIYSGFWFLVYDINGIRQGLSLGFISLAFYFLSMGWQKRYYLAVLGAILFHYTSIIFLPFILITKIKCTNNIFYLLFFTSLIFALLDFSGFLIKFMSTYFGADLRLIQKASIYQRHEDYNANILYSFSTLVRIFILFVTFYFVRKLKISETLKNMFLWGALLNIVIYLSFSNLEIIATRLSLYYRFSECFFFGCLPSAFLGKRNKIIVGFLLCIYVSFQILKVLSIPNNNLEPYKSILF